MRGINCTEERERELFPPSSEHSPLSCFLRLTANFSSLFRSDGTQESTLRRRRRQTNLAERDSRTGGRGRTQVLRKTGETHKGYEGENATKADENSLLAYCFFIVKIVLYILCSNDLHVLLSKLAFAIHAFVSRWQFFPSLLNTTDFCSLARLPAWLSPLLLTPI